MHCYVHCTFCRSRRPTFPTIDKHWIEKQKFEVCCIGRFYFQQVRLTNCEPAAWIFIKMQNCKACLINEKRYQLLLLRICFWCANFLAAFASELLIAMSCSWDHDLVMILIATGCNKADEMNELMCPISYFQKGNELPDSCLNCKMNQNRFKWARNFSDFGK